METNNILENSSLEELISENRDIFFDELNNVIRPTFTGLENPEKYRNTVKKIINYTNRRPFPRQARLIAAAMEHLRKKNKSLLISAEMGTGKTQMGIGISLDERYRVNLIMCPPHLVSKWADEIKAVVNKNKVPYKIVIVTRWDDLVPYTKRDLKKEKCKYYFILSRETAKLSYKKEIAVFKTKTRITEEGILDGETVSYRETVDVYRCPKCGAEVSSPSRKCNNEIVLERDEEGVPVKVRVCGEVLRQPDRNQSERMRTRLSVAEYIKKQWPKGSIDLLIIDEIHEYKGGDTGQGNAMAMICSKAKKIVGLTGTLLNGYASSLFYILYRLNPSLMKKTLGLDYKQVKQFVELYGAHEEVVKAEEVTHEGVVTKMGRKIALKEKPRISPFLLSLLLDFTIFLRLDEIKMEDLSLPDYEESIELVEIDEEFKYDYDSYIGEIVGRIRKDKRFLGNLATDAIAVPDMPYSFHSAQDEIFYTPCVARSEAGKSALIEAGVNEEDIQILPITSKEQRLIEIVESELEQGRKCLVYVHFSNKGVGDDLLKILTDKFSDKKINFLRPSIDAKKRQKWIENNPCDVLIANPELVKTGLDLLEFPTIIFFEPIYNVFTLKQASRRSWRIGQTEDVRVIFMAYENTAQHIALKLIGSKVGAANSLEGRLSGEDDLSSMGDEDDNIQLALAKAILRGEKADNDIKMNKISGLDDRDWDEFEKYFLESLKAYKEEQQKEDLHVSSEPQEEAKEEPEVVPENKIQKAPAVDTQPKPEIALENTENEKITIYKMVKRGKRRVEIPVEVTREEIDQMVEESIGNDTPIQLSLF